MPRKKRMPSYLEDYLTALEAQVLAGEVPNRDEALRPVEQALGRIIDIDEELKKYPEAVHRSGLISRRVKLRIEDGAIDRVAKGKASSTSLLNSLGAFEGTGNGGGGPVRDGNGRLQLHRDSSARVAAQRGKL